MHQTLYFSNVLYADFKNATFEIPYQSFPILMTYAIDSDGNDFLFNNANVEEDVLRAMKLNFYGDF